MKGFESPRRPGRLANAGDLYLLFECRTQRWPTAGLPPRQIQGITAWVTPLAPMDATSKHHQKKHRAMCTCPQCGATVSAGRLAQHKCDSGRLARDRLARQQFMIDHGNAGTPVSVPAVDETVHYRCT